METTNTVISQFNDTINQWIAYLDNYSIDMLQRQPVPGSWSIGQVYVHIIDDTSWFVEQIAAALATDANSDKEMHQHAKAIFANNAFPDMQLQGPSTNASIRQPQDKAALLQELVAIRDKVNTLVSTYDLAASTGKTQHPGFWFFNAAEWLQFAEMHMRHHFRQKKRIDDQLFL
jgi:hypothetical protein